MKRIYSIITAALLLAALLLAGCAAPAVPAPSASPSVTATKAPSPTSAPTIAPSPSPTPTPAPTPEPTKTPIEEISIDYAALEALDGTKDGWGQGLEKDALNRPTGSLDAQEKYGKYDALFIMPEEQKFYPDA